MNNHFPYQKIRIQQENNVTVLTLADPDTHNALSNELLGELCDALSRVSSTVLLLNAEGDDFSIGRPPQSYSAAPETWMKGYYLVMRANELLMRFPGVTIAAVQGHARGAGCSLAGRCDLVVAAETATFSFPELRAGVPPVIVASYYSRKLPWHAFLRLALTGQEVSAAEACRLALVTEVVPDHELFQRARELADDLAMIDAGALATLKHFLLSSESASTPQANRLAYAALLETLASRA